MANGVLTRQTAKWKGDELGLAAWLRGRRVALSEGRVPSVTSRRVSRADVLAGRVHVSVRRRKRLAAAGWLAEAELLAAEDGFDHCAVVVHVTEPGRWLVVLSLEEYRELGRLCGLLPPE